MKEWVIVFTGVLMTLEYGFKGPESKVAMLVQKFSRKYKALTVTYQKA